MSNTYREQDAERVIILKSLDGGLTWVPDVLGGAGAGVGGGAPTDATYLVGAANGTLTNEIVAGPVPAGELGGTWGTPTVNLTHAGTTHALVQAAAEATAAAALAAHVLAADPHAVYLTAAEGNAAYQPLDGDLTTLAGLTATTDNFIVSVASAWASRTPTQVRTTLGLVIGTDVQAWDADLDTIKGLTATTDNFIVSVANAWASRTPAQVKTTLTLNNVDNTADSAKTLTGDVSGTLGATVIGAAKVTKAMHVNAAANSFMGNNTAGAATFIDMTVAQAKTLLAYVAADIPTLAPLASPTFTGTVTLAAMNASGAIASTSTIALSGAASTLGFATGAGGTVTQLTSRVTGVTLSKSCGNIILFSATLAADTTVSFVWTNTLITATSMVVWNVNGAEAVRGMYNVDCVCAAGSATVSVRNVTPAISATEAPILRFMVFQGVTA